MAKLWITEFAALSPRPSDAQIAPLDRALDHKVVTFTTSTPSQALGESTYYVRVQSDTACHIVAGADPTATTSHTPLSAGQPEYFAVRPGNKIAAIVAA